MKIYNLYQASVGFGHNGVNVKTVKLLKDAGFKLTEGKMLFEQKLSHISIKPTIVFYIENCTIEIDNLVRLLSLINLIGRVIIDKDNLTIYDGYIE